MIEIITDVHNLEGTCYIEVLPDIYKGECWNTSSIYFTEENFSYMLPVFEKCCKEFDYYAFNEIDIDTWKVISFELEQLKIFLIEKPVKITLKEVLGFPFVYSEKEFMENYDTNSAQLITMITQFQLWIQKKSLVTSFISVLGI